MCEMIKGPVKMMRKQKNDHSGSDEHCLSAVFFSVKIPALIQQFNLVMIFFIKSSLHLAFEPIRHCSSLLRLLS
ncbi:hypothetical protein BaLi_c05880 [Bacillus paralicheniformis ATCC 9945a]|nr:hypothetical protein BaLi_c05880 [Bacillus paralicheniformis ATCC 9945a]